MAIGYILLTRTSAIFYLRHDQFGVLSILKRVRRSQNSISYPALKFYFKPTRKQLWMPAVSRVACPYLIIIPQALSMYEISLSPPTHVSDSQSLIIQFAV